MFLHLHRRRVPASLGLTLTLLLWVAGPAAAQTGAGARPDHLDDTGMDEKLAAAERDQQAREKFKLGEKSFEGGEYRDAWDYFRQAYVLSQRPKLLYNVGQSADRLGLSKEALKAFRMYLRDAQNPANRRDVENRIRALERRVQREKELSGDASEDGSDEGSEDGSGDANDELDDSLGDMPPVPSFGQPTREGWYFRAALGLGGMYDSVEALEGSGADVSIAGGGLSGEISIGVRMTPELVLGGALFFLISSPKRSDNIELNKANLVLLGPMVDYYLEPASDGLHVQAALGIGSFTMARAVRDGDTIGTKAAPGGGIVLGAGYEWPWSRDKAIGVLARLILARMTEDELHEHTLVILSVDASATWY